MDDAPDVVVANLRALPALLLINLPRIDLRHWRFEPSGRDQFSSLFFKIKIKIKKNPWYKRQAKLAHADEMRLSSEENLLR